jgi:hypothetical protein
MTKEHDNRFAVQRIMTSRDVTATLDRPLGIATHRLNMLVAQRRSNIDGTSWRIHAWNRGSMSNRITWIRFLLLSRLGLCALPLSSDLVSRAFGGSAGYTRIS